jgi:hypothetical protein
MSQLQKFVRGHCTKHPGASARLADFLRSYRSTTGDYKTKRRDVIEQLTEADFPVASDGRVTWIAGLSLGAWQSVDGYLVADHATR